MTFLVGVSVAALRHPGCRLADPGLGGMGLASPARGGAGYLPAWRRSHRLEPFARPEMRVYSPLRLLIRAGFGSLVLRSNS
jgi:hypothetical protein